MAQSWSEYVSGLLMSSARVDKAAVFNITGQPLAASDGLKVSAREGHTILHCLKDAAHTISRITVDDTDFRCFQGNDRCLVGMATGGSGRVLVARVAGGKEEAGGVGGEGVIVVVMGAETAKGSFLFEVQQSLLERTRRLKAPATAQRQSVGGNPSQLQGMPLSKQQQQQQQLSKKLIKPPPPSSSPPPVGQEQVLVQIHD